MKNFLKGSSVLALGDLITKLLTIIYLIPLQHIDAEIPSIMAMLLIPFSFAIIFTTLGINVILNVEFLKYYKKDADKLKQVLVAGIVILTFFSTITIIAMYGGAEALMKSALGPNYITNESYEELVIATKILSVGTVLYAIAVYLRSLLTAFGEYKVISLSYVTEQVLKIALILFGTYYTVVILQLPVGVSAIVVALGIVISMATTPVLYLWKLKKSGYLQIFSEGKHSIDLKIYKRILWTSIIFFSSSIYISAFDQIDLMLLPHLVDPQELTSIQSEYLTLSMKFVMIPIQLSAAFISVMIREIHVDGRDKKDDISKILTIVMVYAIIMMLGVYSAGPEAYNLMYTSSLYGTITFQSLIIPFYITRNMISGYIVTNDGKVTSILLSAVIIIALKAVLDLFYFNIFGLPGLTYASITAIIVSLLILLIPNREMFNVTRKTILEKSGLILKAIILLVLMMNINPFVDTLVASTLIRLILKGVTVCILSALAFYSDYIRLKSGR